MRPHRLLAPALAAVVLASAALAACDPGGRAASPAASRSAPPDARLAAAGRQYSQCVRDHGVSDFPDLTVVNGELVMPGNGESDSAKRALGANLAAQTACQPILDRLPDSARRPHPLSTSDMRSLLRYARCMRDHGIAEFPDPQSDGSFRLPPALEQEGKSSRIAAADRACHQYLGGNAMKVAK